MELARRFASGMFCLTEHGCPRSGGERFAVQVKRVLDREAA